MAEFPFLSAVLVVAAGATASLSYLGYRQRDRPGARTFSLLAGTMAAYAALYAVSLPVSAGPLRDALGAAQWFAIAPLPAVWLLFALEYSGRPEYLTRKITVALSIVPALAVAGAVAHAMHAPGSPLVTRLGDLFYPTTTSTTWMGHTFVSHSKGPLYLLFISVAYASFAAGIAILLEFVVRFDRLYKHQAASLVVGSLFPWLGNVVALLDGEPVPGLDLLPFTLPFTAVLFANAIFRYDLLEFVPATRRRGASALVSDMRDAVVVVDDAERVVDVNPAASDRFGLERSRALGADLETVAGVTLDPDEDRFEVTNDGVVYEVTVSPVHDRFGAVIGRTLVFRDITEHRDAQQRLEVLNRVLRHNLRTEVNVISGYATMVERSLPAEEASMATEIATAAGTLDELGQKAREVERIMSRETDADADTYLLAPLLERAAEKVRDEHPAVEVDVFAPSRAVLLDVDAVVFEAVVADLVDAFAHYGENDVVSLHASTVDGDLTVCASEHGSGIPASEYEVVRRGEETPLEHASGLSLWLVKWGVRSLDGEVAFDDDGDAVLDIAECVVDTGSTALTAANADGKGDGEGNGDSGGVANADGDAGGVANADGDAGGVAAADGGSTDED